MTIMALAYLFVAHDDPYKITITSSRTGQENTTCVTNKVLMGRVLDKEGRANAIESPLSEMPLC